MSYCWSENSAIQKLSINTIINYHACKCSVAHYSSRGISDSGDWQRGMSWAGLKQLMATDHGQHGQTDQRSLSPASLARLSTAPERPMFSLPARSTCTQETTHLALSNCLRPFFFTFFFYILCNPRLQALVYILPSTTAIFSYAIGSRKLSATEQFFVGAQCHL